MIRVSAILLNIFLTYFFLSVLPGKAKAHPNSFWHMMFNPDFGVGYVLIANLCSSAFQFLALSGQYLQFRGTFDKKLWIDIMIYALPLTIAGFGGMINETFDRILLANDSTCPKSWPITKLGSIAHVITLPSHFALRTSLQNGRRTFFLPPGHRRRRPKRPMPG